MTRPITAVGGVRSLRLPTQGRGADHAGADRSHQETDRAILVNLAVCDIL